MTIATRTHGQAGPSDQWVSKAQSPGDLRRCVRGTVAGVKTRPAPLAAFSLMSDSTANLMHILPADFHLESAEHRSAEEAGLEHRQPCVGPKRSDEPALQGGGGS